MSGVNGFGSLGQFYQTTITGLKGKSVAEETAGARRGDPSAARKLRNDARAESAADANKTSGPSLTNGIQDGVKLSDGAQKVLDQLKEKYGNMDFFVANDVSDEEAQDIMSRSNKEYSVLLDAETLEKMAADEDTKNEYMGKIEDATGQLADISEKLKESGVEAANIGVKFDKDGTAKFFADIRKTNENYQKKMQEAKEAAKKDEARAEKAREKKKEDEERIRGGDDDAPAKKSDRIAPGYEKRTTVEADSAEALLEQIQNIDWTQVQATRIPQTGGKFDLAV